MLVISRKRGERIQIGNDIVITIVKSPGNVSIGIQAPRELAITRVDADDTTKPGKTKAAPAARVPKKPAKPARHTVPLTPEPLQD